MIHTHHLSDKCDFLFSPTRETFSGARGVCDYSAYFAYKPIAPTDTHVFVCLVARYYVCDLVTIYSNRRHF